MNERIEQLAEQCWVHTNKPLFGAKSPHWEFDRHKFALLIVGECITTIENADNGYEDYRNQIENGMRNHCISLIKNKFGVEE